MPAGVMGTRGRDSGVSQRAKHHGDQCSSGYIMAPSCQFGGFNMCRDDEQASIVRWHMVHPL